MWGEVEIMALDRFFTPKLLHYMNKGGAAMIFLVAFGLFFNYYDVINLDNIPIPHLTVGLWAYLLINAGIATPFHYLKNKTDENSVCPNCGEPLEINPRFYCKNCGELKFNNK